MATQIKLRRDTYQNWYDNNPVLGLAEPGFDTTNKKLKIGDGTTLWRDLPYFDDQQTDLTTVAQNIIPDADNTRDIGSPDRRWKHGYFASGSLYVGDLKLSNNAGQLVVQQVTDAGLISEAPVPNTPGTVTTDRVVNGTFNVALNATGDFIPGTDNLQDLGSPTNRFRHLYVGPGSITVGASVITESTTGKLVLPGVTRATTLFADEVEDAGDQVYDFSSTPFITDAYDYGVRSGLETPPVGYVKAEYSVDEIDNDGYIDGINIDEQGIWTQAIADANRRNSMFAYVGSDINEAFNPANWVSVPFVVRSKANDVEYEFGGGGSDLGDFTIDGSTLEAEQMTIKTNDGDLNIESDSDVIIKTSGGDKYWSFATDGVLTLPDGGDIVDINGSSVLGGGGGSVDLSNYQAGSDPIRLETTQSLVMLVDDVTGIDASGDELRLYANNHFITLTDQGRLDLDAGIKFQDGTTQTTAYISGTNANTGNVVFDNNQMYVGGVGFLNFNDNSQAVIGTNGSYPLIVSINEGDKTWEFDALGDFYMPDGGAIRFNYGYIDQDPDRDTDALRISGGNGVTIKADEDGKTWRFNNDGSITFPDATVQTTAYTGQSGGSSTVARQDTAPSASNGTLWFNTIEGRLYIKYNDAWVDAAPLMMPVPDTDIDVSSITFPDASILTSAYTNKLVNGVHEVALASNGVLRLADDLILPRTSRWIKDCEGSSGTTSMRWYNIPTGIQEIELFRIYTGEAPNDEGAERAKISLEWQDTDISGLSITAFDRTDGLNEHKWEFKGDGTTVFPTLTVPINDNANPSGTGQTLKFSDPTQQAIIYGPQSTATNTNAERIIIQGAPGYAGTAGEGGDVYLWAGPGGDTNGDGGDIKIRAGRGNGTGTGGYLNFQAGQTSTGTGGYINIESGYSGTFGQGGDITVQARSGGTITLRTTNSQGSSKDWTFGAEGTLTVPYGKLGVATGEVFGIVAEVDTAATIQSDNGAHIWNFDTNGGLTFPGAVINSTVAKTGADLEANNVFFEVTAVDGSGVVTELTVTNSPNPAWTTQTSGSSLGNVNFTVSFDGSGNASVTVNSSGAGHSIGETFNLQPDAVGATPPSRIALDLTKSVNKLTEGSYSLADGVEGQIMYLVPQSGIIDPNNVNVLIANSRIAGTDYTNVALLPLRWYDGSTVIDNSGMCTIIFTDGAWQQQGGFWDMM